MSRSGELKYRKICDILKERIVTGYYKPGEIMCGQQSLSNELGVNRATIRRAQRILEIEGYVTCIPSVGTAVNEIPHEKTLVGYVVRSLQDPFHLELLREIDKLLVGFNAAVVLSESNSAKRALDMGATKIIKAGQLWNTQYEDLHQTVYVGRKEDSRFSVSIDDQLGISLLYQHLKQLGHERLLYISVKLEDTDTYDIRYAHLKSIVQAMELEYLSKNSIFLENYEEGVFSSLADRILSLHEKPTAVICGSDWIAAEILQMMLNRNVRVPEDISITGFDDIYISRYMSVPLTTINFPIEECAKQIVSMLFEHQQKKPYQVVLNPNLIIRNSTCKVQL